MQTGEARLTIIDRYVLRQCLIPIMATIMIGLLVLSAARFLIVFDLVLGNDQGMLIVARLLGAFVPHYLAFMLPLSIYWGSYVVVRQLTVNSEVNILQATGSSIGRTFRMLLVLGAVFACLNAAVVGWLQPLGRYTYRALAYNLENADFYLRVRDSTFMNIGPRTVFAEKINPDRRSFEKILIHERLDKGGSMTIVAPRGSIIRLGERLSLRLSDGQRMLIENPAEPDSVQTMNFDVLDVPAGGAAEPFRRRGEDEQELLLPELIAQKVPIGDATMADLSMALHKKLVIALSCLFLPMLGIVLGVQSARKKNLYQSVAALLIIIVYHQLVEFTGDFGKGLAIGPAVALWSLYGVFFVTTLVLFYKTSTGIGPISDRIASRLDRIGIRLDPSARLRGRPQTP
ncbi:LptF/LptG family permease [Aestuariivirga sp.]|uniref:LptF/LptG family permease n=1 Tax=Aestuariivirga sp. TaxID=2650926 RepID=UPI0025C473F9|nr:LptF/LptG family permease [Aestuariivirga sp.]MCA3555400.1 LptF/LptG family permease [Aestuariivirga sp.]